MNCGTSGGVGNCDFETLKPCREGNFYRKKPCTCTGFLDPKNRVRTRVFSGKTVYVHGFLHDYNQNLEGKFLWIMHFPFIENSIPYC